MNKQVELLFLKKLILEILICGAIKNNSSRCFFYTLLKDISLATLTSSFFHKSIFSKVKRTVGPLILIAVDTSPAASTIGAATIHPIPGGYILHYQKQFLQPLLFLDIV